MVEFTLLHTRDIDIAVVYYALILHREFVRFSVSGLFGALLIVKAHGSRKDGPAVSLLHTHSRLSGLSLEELPGAVRRSCTGLGHDNDASSETPSLTPARITSYSGDLTPDGESIFDEQFDVRNAHVRSVFHYIKYKLNAANRLIRS